MEFLSLLVWLQLWTTSLSLFHWVEFPVETSSFLSLVLSLKRVKIRFASLRSKTRELLGVKVASSSYSNLVSGELWHKTKTDRLNSYEITN